MRILHVVPTYLPAMRYGGPIYSVHGLCKALAALGHDVHVFTTSVDGDGDSDVPLGTPVDLDGVKVWYFPSRILRRLYWSPAMAKQLQVAVASFDVVHLHSVFLWPTWAAARAAVRANVPYVLTPRGMLVKDLIQRKSRWLKTIWIRLIERTNIKRASLLHFTAELERMEFEQFGFQAPVSCVIPNGVDLPGLADSNGISADVVKAMQGEPYLLFLGRINWKKGIDRLLRALKEIPAQRLIIAGNDEEGYLDTLYRLIAEYGVADRVTLIARFVSGNDKQALFEQAIVFVLPSYSENFGNTVPEAMSVGCPVVVTREVGAAELLLESSAGLVVAGDELGSALRGLLTDTEKLDSMGVIGKSWVEANLTWEQVATKMLDRYRHICTND